jgi:hypothetical protein
MYFAIGTFVEMGVEAEDIFDIVHRANIKKVIYNVKLGPDLKVGKPKHWTSPEPQIGRYLEYMESLGKIEYLCDACDTPLTRKEYVQNKNTCTNCLNGQDEEV